ncbi:MAG: trehalose-6-phosphate synthase [Candidatus Eisenbacteria bacterium]
MSPTGNRLVVVSNRLPIVMEKDGGGWSARPGSGGLVTAMAPVLRDRGGLWIGWPGAVDAPRLNDFLGEAGREAGYDLRAVRLTAEEERDFYVGFCNEILWPLFHDLVDRCNMDPDYWGTYRTVNGKYAEALRSCVRPGDITWVHDYHLMGVAREFRDQGGGDLPISFFLHIPFPPPDIFLKLPWRSQVLEDLLQYDLIGFQTQRDRRNFTHCLSAVLREPSIRGKGRVITASHEGRAVRLGVFPIGIDYAFFDRESGTEEVSSRAWEIHSNLPKRQIILGVDRLDYTKGIPQRLRAFSTALRKHPELIQNVTLAQVVVPSREDVPEYRTLKTEIDRLVGEINGQFTRHGWVPIQYMFRSLTRDQLLGYYRTAEIALVTPLKDGMNLVAKEYCACSIEENGVLILSEFAGAAAQLRGGALLVNPYDREAVGDAIFRAYHMGAEERGVRMRRLRQTCRNQDIFWWVDSFLRAAVSKELHDFSALDRGFRPSLYE